MFKKYKNKRSILNPSKNHKNLLSSNNFGEILSFTYSFNNSENVNLTEKRPFELAVEQMNQLGMIQLSLQTNESWLYPNIVFVVKSWLDVKSSSSICETSNDAAIRRYTRIFFNEVEDSNSSTFATITCKTDGEFFKSHGVGVIHHEFGHMLGIQHTHMASYTDGILKADRPRPNLKDQTQWLNHTLGSILNIFNYKSDNRTCNYTLASPFSIQHYPIGALKPWFSYNLTRIDQLLNDFHFSKDLYDKYYYFLNSVAGTPLVYTYQDLLGLVQAVYNVAPNSLVGKNFNLEKYNFIEGIDWSKTDKLNFKQLLDALYQAEGFSYPILAQKRITTSVQKAVPFNISLYNELKIVSLTNNTISCLLGKYDASLVEGNFSVSEDCFLRGKFTSLNTLLIPIILQNNQQTKECIIQLFINKRYESIQNQLAKGIEIIGNFTDDNANKHYGIMNEDRVLVGIDKPTYILQNTSTIIDLIDICHAVALPKERNITCSNIKNATHEIARLMDDCQLQLQEKIDNNIEVTFYNGNSSKKCFITLSSQVNANFLAEDFKSLAEFTEKSSNYVIPLTYCVGIPFIHGFLDKIIDEIFSNIYLKYVLKIIPVTTLCYYGFFNKSCLFGSLAMSALENVLEKILTNYPNLSKSTQKRLLFFVNISVYVIMTEWQYYNSKILELSDSLDLWPKLMDKLSPLFFQFFLSPAIKFFGYAVASELCKHCCVATQGVEMHEYSATEIQLFENKQGFQTAVHCPESHVIKQSSFLSFFSCKKIKQHDQINTGIEAENEAFHLQ